MAISHHRDVMSAKYITAVITDSNDRAYFCPIKYVIGDHFIVRLQTGLYVFSLRNARILITGDVGSKHARFILYDTSHTKALNAARLQELGKCLTLNGLPKIDRGLLDLLALIARREKASVAKREAAVAEAAEAAEGERPFEPTDVTALLDELEHAAKQKSSRENRWPDEAAALAAYLRGLGLDEVVTPVRGIVDYIQGDLITTDPSFLGALTAQFSALDRENRTMTNTPKKSTVSWLKWGMLLGVGLAMVGMLYAGSQAGWFDGFGEIASIAEDISSVGGDFSAIAPGGDLLSGSLASPQADCSDSGLQQRYPTPWDLKVAIDSGAESCTPSKELAESLKNIAPPAVTPVAEPAAPPAAAAPPPPPPPPPPAAGGAAP